MFIIVGKLEQAVEKVIKISAIMNSSEDWLVTLNAEEIKTSVI
jgi:hypothetical protein